MKEELSFSLLKDEEIVYRAYVGKKIIAVYVLFFLILTIVFVTTLTGAFFSFVKAGLQETHLVEREIVKDDLVQKSRTPVAIIIISAVYVFLSIVLYFSLKSTLGREYVLTNQRIFIAKGGKLLRYKRYLMIGDITGIEKSSNLITNVLSIASIDFYSHSLSENKKTFLKVISLSSTQFRFQWIYESDADQIFEKIQCLISDYQNGKLDVTRREAPSQVEKRD